MPENRARRAEELAMHHDGQLGREDGARIERALAASPEARAQLEAMRRVDRSLREVFASAGEPTSVAPASLAMARQRPGALVMVRNIAAAILVAAVVGWLVWPAGQFPKSSAIPRTVDVFFDREVARGFVPDAVCTDDAQFGAFTREQVGLAMMAVAEPDVEIIGWGYPRDAEAMGMPSGTVSLLGRVDGEPVLVLMAPSGTVARPRTQWLGGHRVFRRDVAGVEVVEISPLGAPRILPLLRVVPCPEQDPDLGGR
jgi:anti-sigma factor RsiW